MNVDSEIEASNHGPIVKSSQNKLPAIGSVKGASARLMVHDYNATRGSINFGREWGVMLALPINKQFGANFKYARYHADKFATDTGKFWFALEAKF